MLLAFYQRYGNKQVIKPFLNCPLVFHFLCATHADLVTELKVARGIKVLNKPFP